MNLHDLSQPFPHDDIEWRVSRSGHGKRGIYCVVLAYITARAIQKRLDEVCSVENWKLEEPRIIEVNGKSVFSCGISIRIADEWVTKWDVSEPTNIEPAKGGFSGAMKRAGAQWGIGRYLYYLDETWAEVSDVQPEGSRKWNRAKLSKRGEEAVFYYWKNPSLPAWALPKEPEHEITGTELEDLKQSWRAKFASDVKNTKDLREGFSRFVVSVAGEFPLSDYTCWTRHAFDQCVERIESTTDPEGVDSDVPFDG